MCIVKQNPRLLNPQALDVPRASQIGDILVERCHGKDPGKDVDVDVDSE